MNKIYFILCLSLGFLYSNDYPVWDDIPNQSIDEDCENGCINGEFLFDLEDFDLRSLDLND